MKHQVDGDVTKRIREEEKIGVWAKQLGKFSLGQPNGTAPPPVKYEVRKSAKKLGLQILFYES